MNASHLTRTAHTVPAAVTLMVTGALLVGCGGGRPPTPSGALPPPIGATTAQATPPANLPDASTVSRVDGSTLLRQACEVIFTRDPQRDASYSTSYRRAADVMTPELRRVLIQPPKSVRPLPMWVQWKRDRVWIKSSCDIGAEEHPADTASSVSRILLVTEHHYTRAGHEIDTSTAAVWATAARTSAGWAVDRFDISYDN